MHFSNSSSVILDLYTTATKEHTHTSSIVARLELNAKVKKKEAKVKCERK